MAKQRIYGFDSEQSFKRVQEAARITLNTPTNGAQRTRRQPVISQTFFIRYAELLGNLSPASNSKTGRSNCSAKFLMPDPDNAGELIDGDNFVLYNRSLDATGLAGDFCIVVRMGDEWHLLWLDC